MRAYEFYAKQENGFIKIPDEYRKKLNPKFKVIIVEDNEEKNSSIRDLLLPPILDTRGWKFDKEEANER